MGAKTPDGYQQGPDGNGQLDKPCDSTANRPRNSSSSGDLDRGIVGEEDGDDSDEEARLNEDQGKAHSTKLSLVVNQGAECSYRKETEEA